MQNVRDAMPVRPWLVLFVSFSMGCLSQVIPEHQPAATEEPQLRAMLASHQFEAGPWARVNHAPFSSDLAPDQRVTMYVSPDAAAAYEAVTPDADATSGPEFPVGGVVVRAATDDNGTPVALTVMAKREPGFYPEAGDFFFGVTDLDGTPIVGGGEVQWGALHECGTCHASRAAAGFLFGVARANR